MDLSLWCYGGVGRSRL